MKYQAGFLQISENLVVAKKKQALLTYGMQFDDANIGAALGKRKDRKMVWFMGFYIFCVIYGYGISVFAIDKYPYKSLIEAEFPTVIVVNDEPSAFLVVLIPSAVITVSPIFIVL